MSLRLKHILRAQRGHVGQHDGIVGPIAANFDNAGENFFIRAKSGAPVTAERAFFAEFRFVGLPLEAIRDADFACRRLRERQRAAPAAHSRKLAPFPPADAAAKKLPAPDHARDAGKILEIAKRAQ